MTVLSIKVLMFLNVYDIRPHFYRKSVKLDKIPIANIDC